MYHEEKSHTETMTKAFRKGLHKFVDDTKHLTGPQRLFYLHVLAKDAEYGLSCCLPPCEGLFNEAFDVYGLSSDEAIAVFRFGWPEYSRDEVDDYYATRCEDHPDIENPTPEQTKLLRWLSEEADNPTFPTLEQIAEKAKSLGMDSSDTYIVLGTYYDGDVDPAYMEWGSHRAF
jgi:hypothetical protein